MNSGIHPSKIISIIDIINSQLSLIMPSGASPITYTNIFSNITQYFTNMGCSSITASQTPIIGAIITAVGNMYNKTLVPTIGGGRRRWTRRGKRRH